MQKRGFTLIEILVSVTIIAVLSAIGVASYSSVNKRSRDAKRKSDLEQVRSALEMYRAENGSYPGAGTAYGGLPNKGAALVPDYLPAIPSDPKGTQYRLLRTSTSYCLCGTLETLASPYSECTPDTGCNYALKNP